MGFVIEYHEELEVDLLRSPERVDLLDFWRGILTPRRLELLVRWLPADSLTVRRIDPEIAEMARYGPGDYVLMHVYDLLGAAHFKDAKPFPRPADVIAERRRNERMTAFLEAQAERNRLRDQMRQDTV